MSARTAEVAPGAPAATAKPVAPTARLNDLEGYRGLAALGIVVFHAYQFARGDAGSAYAYPHTIAQSVLRNLDGLVSMFLILSGYLLYVGVARNIFAGARAGVVKVFMLRRAARILPLYWLAILLVWAYRNPSLPGDWRDLVEHLTFTQVFDSKRVFYTIGPAWSLSVEVIFYAFLAVGYFALNRLTKRVGSTNGRRALLFVLPLLLLVMSLAWQGWALFISHQPATRWAIWFNPIARADTFAVGMLVAILHASRSSSIPITRRILIPLRFGALLLLILGCIIRTDDALKAAEFNLISVVAFGLLIYSSVFDNPSHLWRRMLAGPRLAWLGVVSYSLYMWHEPVLLYIDAHFHLDHAPDRFPIVALVLLAVSIPVAWVSYRIIERPFGRLRLLLDGNGQRRNFYPSANPVRLNAEHQVESVILAGSGNRSSDVDARGGPG